MTKFKLPRTYWRKSGWGYRTATPLRRYVTVFRSPNEPVTTFLTTKRALEYIREQEKNSLGLPDARN